MQKILVVTSSLSGDAGNSTALVNFYLSKLEGKNVELDILNVDELNLPHLSKAEMAAWMTEPADRSETQERLAATSDALIERVVNADKIIIGLPMYNLGVPSTFKAWIDRIARAGKTFKYTENGPVGLLDDKPVLVLAARGGVYAGTEYDTQTPYIRHIFGLFGIHSIDFVYAEGVNISPEKAEKAIFDAQEKIIELLDKEAD